VRRAALSTVATTCLALALAACRAPLLPPPSVPSTNAPGLHVLLTWDAPVDLDLYVTDPSWETVYFANTPSRAGGRLERDVRCDRLNRAGPQTESVRFVVSRPGPYRAGVDFIDDCGNDIKEVSFRIVVELEGRRLEATKTVRRERFQAIAFEFEVDMSGRKVVAKKSLQEGADDATK
jgi:hypothetical protein